MSSLIRISKVGLWNFSLPVCVTEILGLCCYRRAEATDRCARQEKRTKKHGYDIVRVLHVEWLRKGDGGQLVERGC